MNYRLLRKIGKIKVVKKMLYHYLNMFSRKGIVAQPIEKLCIDRGGSSFVCRQDDWLKYEYDLDIIIPVYNMGRLLESCLISILEQETKAKYKIIIVDDGSDSKLTHKIISKYIKDARVELIKKPNGGLSSARNEGLLHSKGKYILFVDADDVLYPNSIEIMFDTACRYNADIVEGSYKNITERKKVLKEYKHKAGIIVDLEELFGYAWGKLFSRRLFFDVQFPDKYYYEDSIIKTIVYPRASCIIAVEDWVYGYTRNKKGISFLIQNDNRSLDSYYVNKKIFDERKKFNLPYNKEYYEYLLGIIRLTYIRNMHLSDAYQLDVFLRWCEMIRTFDDIQVDNEKYILLVKYLNTKDYGSYKKWCIESILEE